jgi:hypothetical protein
MNRLAQEEAMQVTLAVPLKWGKFLELKKTLQSECISE